MSQQHNTRYAEEQSQLLRKTLGRVDVVLMMVSAVVGLEMLGSVSGQGAQTLTWLVVLIVVFLVPYALIFAETGSAFVGEGGVYLWVRDAFGRAVAAVASAFTWITQPVWVGGSMSLLTAEAFREHVVHFASGSVGDYLFKLGFIWFTVLGAVLSLKRAKWIPSLGAACKVAFLALFIVTAVGYAASHGVQPLHAGSFSPTLAGFITLVPLLLFAFLGFELGSATSGEMHNAQHDVPFALLRSAASAAVLYLLPVLTIILVIPPSDIDGVSGLINAVATVFSVYGGGADAMLVFAILLFLVANLGQGAAWMIMSDRMQAMTAADGAFFGPFFGKFNGLLGTPIRVNLLSGSVSTVFMMAAMQLTGTSADLFNVVLSVSITTYLFSYLIVIPAAVRLRLKFPNVHRPYRVPGPNAVFVTLGVVTTAFVALASWVSIFPGTIEVALGLAKDLSGATGVSYASFEALTLGTLGFIVAIALIGFVVGKRTVR